MSPFGKSAIAVALQRNFIKLLIISTIFVFYINVHRLYFSRETPVSISRDNVRYTIENILRTSKTTCIHPVLELWPPSLRQYFEKPAPLECSKVEENWVYVENGTFIISSAASKRHVNITCAYTPLLRGRDDFKTKWGETVANMKNGTRLKTDFFTVTCTSNDKANYSNLHAGIVRTAVPNPSPSADSKRALGLNVIMIGFDSVSRLMWIRLLPKTYDYLVKILGAVVLEGYNIVGDATTAALLPMFTGKHEQELPESRKRFKGGNTLDDHPWIWKYYKQLGYVTQMAEDVSKWGCFTGRLRGFRNQPVDHFMRTYYLVSEEQKNLSKAFCAGSQPRHMVHLNYLRDLFRAYPARTRKFSFMFSGDMTHDYTNQLQLADDDVLAFLKDINRSGYLNDTVLIMMADHGPRFSKWRQSLQGKLEERSPFMSFRFPPSFEKTHPEAMKNLRTNAQRLSTPFDIHATLQDIANYSGVLRTNVKQRSISLLSEIPANRTCEQADIAPHWCTCLTWTTLDVGDEKVKNVTAAMLATINNQTKSFRDKCATLSLVNVTQAVRYTPNKKILKFKGEADPDKYRADMSDNMKNSYVLYQVNIRTKPGGALFEGTVTHHLKDDRFDSSVQGISRINKYGNQPHCVMKELPHLRKFCYCK